MRKGEGEGEGDGEKVVTVLLQARANAPQTIPQTIPQTTQTITSKHLNHPIHSSHRDQTSSIDFVGGAEGAEHGEKMCRHPDPAAPRRLRLMVVANTTGSAPMREGRRAAARFRVAPNVPTSTHGNM